MCCLNVANFSFPLNISFKTNERTNEKKVHRFFPVQFFPCHVSMYRPEMKQTFSPFTSPSSTLNSRPPRNSRRTPESKFPFSALRVVMTIPEHRKKIRQYRIKVYSTPRWSSRYNQVGLLATLAKLKVQLIFLLFSIEH